MNKKLIGETSEQRAKRLYSAASDRYAAALTSGDWSTAQSAKNAMGRARHGISVSWWRGEREVAWGW